MALVAAAGSARNEHRAERRLLIALHPPHNTVDGSRRVGDDLLPVGRQNVHRQAIFGYLESGDMIEAPGLVGHALMVVRWSWIVLGLEGPLPFGWSAAAEDDLVNGTEIETRTERAP